jgi:hypothetical protein
MMSNSAIIALTTPGQGPNREKQCYGNTGAITGISPTPSTVHAQIQLRSILNGRITYASVDSEGSTVREAVDDEDVWHPPRDVQPPSHSSRVMSPLAKHSSMTSCLTANSPRCACTSLRPVMKMISSVVATMMANQTVGNNHSDSGSM